jgi:hypothetical protein
MSDRKQEEEEKTIPILPYIVQKREKDESQVLDATINNHQQTTKTQTAQQQPGDVAPQMSDTDSHRRDLDCDDANVDAVQRDPKKMCNANGIPCIATMVKTPRMTMTADPTMFYPPGLLMSNPNAMSYASFDPECVIADGDAQNSQKGVGGKMLFLKYMDKARGVAFPLCIQSPKVFLPAGVGVYAEKGPNEKPNVNALCSLGREWGDNPNMTAFRELCDSVQQACHRLTINKGMNEPFCKDIDSVAKSFTPFVNVTERPDPNDPSRLITYPPSFKLVINTAVNNATILVMEVKDSKGVSNFEPIPYASVLKGSSITPMIHFNWIFRKRAKNGYAFNIRASMHQAIVEPPGGGSGGSEDGNKVCKLSVVV